MPQKTRLFLASFLGLFLELVLIRWFPAYVFSLAFFSNVVLIASFLGLGLGFLLLHYKREFFDFFPYLLGCLILLVLFSGYIRVTLPADAQTWIWSYYQGNRLAGISFLKLSIVQLVGIIFALTVAIFVPIGQKIGRLMHGLSALQGYSINIAGSLLGVIGFAILAALHAPPYAWFLVITLLTAAINYKKNGLIAGIAVLTVIVAITGFREKDILWSPYYAIEWRETDNKSIAVYVNKLFHQKAVNFTNEPATYEKYMFPYRWFEHKRVLIIGSGTGNDVWVARKAGAELIDAVEIDPGILKLGYQKHPQHPYDSERVRVFVDDARSFMHRAGEKYDMIVYGTLDSHATLSATSSIRLDNYVYTQEALQETKELLAPQGVMVLLFSVPTDWLAVRLLDTVRSVFGPEYTRYFITDKYLFNLVIVAGPGVKYALSRNENLSNVLHALPAQSSAVIPRDNWPYLYLQCQGIPRLYWTVLVFLILFSAAAILIFSPLKPGKIDPLFFLLGCGFLLLETKSVTTFSLLFGSTWVVNAVVFSAVLAIALVANWLVQARHLKNPTFFMGSLIVSLVLLYFLPVTGLLGLRFIARIFSAGILVALPIFFTSVLFAIFLKDARETGIALGSNLLGAVIGGFLEYTSMIWGLNALYIVALGCYLIAAFYIIKRRSIFRGER